MKDEIRANCSSRMIKFRKGDRISYDFGDFGVLEIAYVAVDDDGLFLQFIPAIRVEKKAPDA